MNSSSVFFCETFKIKILITRINILRYFLDFILGFSWFKEINSLEELYYNLKDAEFNGKQVRP